MSRPRRIAFLPDTFHEVNGVAHTSRQLQAFAKRHDIPFLSIHCGPSNEIRTDGSVSVLELQRGPMSFPLDSNLYCDPLLFRYAYQVLKSLKFFGADVIHITGPGDMGCLGAFAAWKLKLPLGISWHTNLHEYAKRRVCRLLGLSGKRASVLAGRTAEMLSLRVLRWFYRRGQILFAPNPEIGEWLRAATGRPVFPMGRGVDRDLFSPSRRERTDTTFRIGYVGRLTPEKNVRLLARLGRALLSAGHTNFEFQLIGEGSEQEWLRTHVPHGVMRGVLVREQLAQAYANMDLFVFPSETDTFGNVVLEALSSGVPVIVKSGGGPKFLVEDGRTGFVARSDDEFIARVEAALDYSVDLSPMQPAARAYASRHSWDTVFMTLFAAYDKCLCQSGGISATGWTSRATEL